MVKKLSGSVCQCKIRLTGSISPDLSIDSVLDYSLDRQLETTHDAICWAADPNDQVGGSDDV